MKIKKTKVTNAFINPAFTQDDLLCGQEGYHCQNPPANKEIDSTSRDHFRLGVELEVCFRNYERAETFRETPRNWYEMENDNSLTQGETQGEIITLPLRTEDACNPEFWRPLCDELTRASAFSWDAGCCGLHVHASKCGLLRKAPEGMDAKGTVENAGLPESVVSKYIVDCADAKRTAVLLYMYMVEDTEEAKRVFGRENGSHYLKVEDTANGARAVKEGLTALGCEALKSRDVTKKAKAAMPAAHACVVNISNPDTIEFRQGRGSLRPERIAAICLFVTLFMRFCQKFTNLDCMTISRDLFKEYLRKNCPSTHPLAFYLGTEH